MNIKRLEKKTLMYQYDKELASAFQVDCEDLLNEFEKYQSFNFVDFQRVWHNKSFSLIFAGQIYALLLRDFCENCFWVVKKYIMFPRSMFTQLGAFYLLYGLYYKQPLKEWVKIRLTLEEYQKLDELILEMKNRNHMDAVYMFSKMRADEVFLYIAQRKPLGPEDRFVKGIELFINDTFTASKTQSALMKFENLCKSNIFNIFEETSLEYNKSMEKFTKKDASILPFSTNLSKELKKAYVEFYIEPQSLTTTREYVKESKSIRSARKAIKAKALKNKRAVYRADRKVKTAVDVDVQKLEYSSNLFSSDVSCKPSTSSQPDKTLKRKKIIKTKTGSKRNHFK